VPPPQARFRLRHRLLPDLGARHDNFMISELASQAAVLDLPTDKVRRLEDSWLAITACGAKMGARASPRDLIKNAVVTTILEVAEALFDKDRGALSPQHPLEARVSPQAARLGLRHPVAADGLMAASAETGQNEPDDPTEKEENGASAPGHDSDLGAHQYQTLSQPAEPQLEPS